MSEQDNGSPEDRWQDEATAAVYQFGEALTELHRSNPWPDLPLLPRALNHLMTELWDHGFSQTEIREAYLDAVADIARYTAGDEVRP